MRLIGFSCLIAAAAWSAVVVAQPREACPPGAAGARCEQSSASRAKTEGSAGGKFSCAGKRRCGEMRSCAEARHYLTQCGVRSLDRDRDGIPCESLCGVR